MEKFRTSRLWMQAFHSAPGGGIPQEATFLETHLLAMRERVAPIVARILRDMPGYTVHDITHLDALWETASLVAAADLALTPAEGFVLGGAILLHDAAMTLAAYPGGLNSLRETVEWRDVQALKGGGSDPARPEISIVVEVLRLLHAKSAERLATQAWPSKGPLGEDQFDHLIEHAELRNFYGSSIGVVASSHWWPIEQVARDLNRHLGPLPPFTESGVDLLKVSCLLRVADATHLDRRRAPQFVRAIDRPQGISNLHWSFQGRLSFPRLVDDALEFSAGAPCPVEEAESWWLGYEAFRLADRELRQTDIVLKDLGRSGLSARRIKGANDPLELARTVPVIGWKPVETEIHVSDVGRVIETLGGKKIIRG